MGEGGKVKLLEDSEFSAEVIVAAAVAESAVTSVSRGPSQCHYTQLLAERLEISRDKVTRMVAVRFASDTLCGRWSKRLCYSHGREAENGENLRSLHLGVGNLTNVVLGCGDTLE